MKGCIHNDKRSLLLNPGNKNMSQIKLRIQESYVTVQTNNHPLVRHEILTTFLKNIVLA